jgi:putative DNA primase/helicase
MTNEDARKKAAKLLADKYVRRDGGDPDAPGAAEVVQLYEPEPMTKQEVADEIKRLATLSPIDYEREREQAKRLTGYRLTTLDALVEIERKMLPPPDAGPNLDRPPAVEPVVGAELIADLITDLTKYVSLEPDYAATAAFWVIHTYLLDYGGFIRITPRLAITAPEKRCGKTTFIDWLSTVVQRPKRSDNITAAVVFRVVDERHPTLLIDEADTFLGARDELKGVLNSGHRSDGTVDRYIRGRGLVPFSTYSACAISLIGGLPGPIQDRSIRIRLRRRMPEEKVTSLRADRPSDTLARRCARWTLDNRDDYATADPAVPAELFNRVEDNWRPLLAIADVIGGEWPGRLREIAVNIALLEAGEDPSTGTQLLRDIHEIFGGEPWITTDSLLWGLQRRDYTAMTGKKLATLLKPYGIGPRQERRGVRVERGYLAKDFADAFLRYLNVPLVPLVPEAAEATKEVPAAPELSREVPAATGTNGTNGTQEVKPRFQRRF